MDRGRARSILLDADVVNRLIRFRTICAAGVSLGQNQTVAEHALLHHGRITTAAKLAEEMTGA